MNSELDYWLLLAGIGIFLFGIHLMEESIKKLSGQAFKVFIRKYTETPIKAILSGTFATAILQSSSAVTLMILAFAGAGIMSLSNAIGVIIGSNLGTTLTSWLVATIGFKVNIESLSLPIIGIGGLLLIFFSNSEKLSNISKLIVSFGFLFMGLDYMKSSIDGLVSTFDFTALATYSVPIFVLIGFALTAVVQSSSAAMAITLSIVFTGVISFDKAAAMVIGTNLGTTLKVILGSLGGPMIKKQIGLSHFFFNLIVGIVTLIFLPLLVDLVYFLGFKNDPVIGLALFHTIFNLLGVLLFLPFLKLFAKIIEKLIKPHDSDRSNILHNLTYQIPEAAIAAIEKVYSEMLLYVMDHNLRLVKIDPKLITGRVEFNYLQKQKTIPKAYEHIKQAQTDLLSFGAKLQKESVELKDSIRLNQLLHSVRFLVASAKAMKDITKYLEEIAMSEEVFMIDHYVVARKFIMEIYQRMIQVVQMENAEMKLPELLHIRQEIILKDEKWIRELTNYLSQNNLSEETINLFISTNRGLILSCRQLVASLRDSTLKEEELKLFENL